MTPVQKLKEMIIQRHIEMQDLPSVAVTAENVDALFEQYESDAHDAREEIRIGEYNTGLQTPYSSYFSQVQRNYEYDEVAAQTLDGSWIGWTYYHGGGKHSEPSAIPWVDYAYSLDCKEEEKLVTVRTFAKPA
jgi:hypothetical protein